MRTLKTIFLWILTAAMLCSSALAEETEASEIVAIVNGTQISLATLEAAEEQYLYTYYSNGYNVEDEVLQAYISDLALTSLIEAVLVDQDMNALGLNEFSEAEEAEFVAQAQTTYDEFFAACKESYLTLVGGNTAGLSSADANQADIDATAYAIYYTQLYGYTVENFAEDYRYQAVLGRYYDHLMEGIEFTDEEVYEAYEARIEASRQSYAENIPAYENALYYNQETWYAPEGYRSVLQILLNTDAEGNVATLENVADTIEAIYSRLDAGESFESLIAEYGQDTSFNDPTFYEIGYQVHPESIIWDETFVTAAFSEDMVEPGDVSQPFEGNGVRILYYLHDVPSGAASFTDEIAEALKAVLYQETLSEKIAERKDELAANAEVEIFAAAAESETVPAE